MEQKTKWYIGLAAGSVVLFFAHIGYNLGEIKSSLSDFIWTYQMPVESTIAKAKDFAPYATPRTQLEAERLWTEAKQDMDAYISTLYRSNQLLS